jgi:hypothetical protein
VREPQAYCFSQAVEVFTAWLCSSVLFPVMVVTFPFLDTTVVYVAITLPAFFDVVVVVFGSTRLTAVVSAPPGLLLQKSRNPCRHSWS